MDTNIIPKEAQEVSTVVKVDRASLTRWTRIKAKISRDGKMMLFEDYRVSLGGADAGWGTKVFKKSLSDIGFVEECDKEAGQKGTFCPTEKALEKYERLFYYDDVGDIWGLSDSHIEEFDELVLPVLVKKAIDVRHQFKEGAKRRAQARYIENKKTDTPNTLF